MELCTRGEKRHNQGATTGFWHFGLVGVFNCHNDLQNLDVLQSKNKIKFFKNNHLILMLERCQGHLRSKSIRT